MQQFYHFMEALFHFTISIINCLIDLYPDVDFYRKKPNRLITCCLSTVPLVSIGEPLTLKFKRIIPLNENEEIFYQKNKISVCVFI